MRTHDLWHTIGTALATTFGTVPGSTIHLTATGWIVATGEPGADFNMLLVDEGPNPAGQFREFIEVLDSRGLQGLAFLTAPVAAQLTPLARELHLQSANRVPVMLSLPGGADADEAGPLQERFRIERVTAETLGESMRLAAETFGVSPDVIARVYSPTTLALPGVDIFLARDGDEPVSTVTTTATGATVGVWTMATAPSRQRQGAGRAVLAHAMREQRETGAERFYLLATESGKPLYERMGFQTVSELAVWVRGTSVQVTSA
jgi:GNAT superfamily N-acetyltransferase